MLCGTTMSSGSIMSSGLISCGTTMSSGAIMSSGSMLSKIAVVSGSIMSSGSMLSKRDKVSGSISAPNSCSICSALAASFLTLIHSLDFTVLFSDNVLSFPASMFFSMIILLLVNKIAFVLFFDANLLHAYELYVREPCCYVFFFFLLRLGDRLIGSTVMISVQDAKESCSPGEWFSWWLLYWFWCLSRLWFLRYWNL